MAETTPTKTRIPGKDLPLEETLTFMQEQLQKKGFQVEAVSWLNPLPQVWSVHVQDKDCPQLFTNGKGRSADAALASALGEFFERLSCNYFWADFWLGPEIAAGEFVHYPQERWFEVTPEGLPAGLLDAHCLEIYQQNQQLEAANLVDINSGSPQRGICALPFVRQADQQTCYFPVNLIGNLYVSNGMAAGNNCWEARVQALSEIFERAVKNHLLSEGLCPPRIPDSVLQQYPAVVEGLQALEAAGFQVQARDASMGGRFPVINITLLNPEDGGCFASFGAHPLFEVALERTLTELVQGRALDELDVFPAPTMNLDEVAEPHNLETHFIDSSGLVGWPLIGDQPDYEFVHWNFPGTSREQFDWLIEQLHQEGHQVYLADYDHLGVAACRILVPGFSEIYPLDDLTWDNNNQGLELRDALLELPELDRPQQAELLDLLVDSGFNDQQPVAALIGLAPGGSSFWKELRVGELKAMLCLALGELESALDLINGLLLFGHLHQERQKHYRCLACLLELQLARAQPSDFMTSLEAYFGQQEIHQCLELLEGKKTFHGFTPAPGLSGLQAHERLLEAYRKVQHAKTAIH
ncbi:30S ribosomal protein S12 methylthiotransferase accessory factor YcaO [Marinospirillum perlucidum]|uniref:30S ribosomal protein S12 methylthiotransferase accessory factor YcaO n=1 Tax=Marinospirillum perlucidum TaxID=1982602 RepID=UPI000DF4037A|nr:30S ribosomal protein S12 methylthiotransferase accessory factor YcaO [Marinospirillum perlucidum]